MGGVLGGLSGTETRALVTAWLFGLAIAGAVCVFNAITRLHDWPEQGWVRPLVLEGSSFVVLPGVFLIPAAVALWMHRAHPAPWRAARVHLPAAAIYWGLHVLGFTVMRALAFPIFLHETYRPGPPAHELPYELAKDLLAYALAVAAFWMLLRWSPASQPAQADGPGVFDIRDGARLVRAPIEEILAVRSAGNYVEFLLADGRRPLMRRPLAAIEAELAGCGFVRIHRSWVVNAGRVTGLRPEGSGDYAVELGPLEAPLSRRFPQALAALRG